MSSRFKRLMLSRPITTLKYLVGTSGILGTRYFDQQIDQMTGDEARAALKKCMAEDDGGYGDDEDDEEEDEDEKLRKSRADAAASYVRQRDGGW